MGTLNSDTEISHDHFKVIQSDKMNITTIITFIQYDQLAIDILNGDTYYKGLNRDYTNTIQLVSRFKFKKEKYSSIAPTEEFHNSML